MLSLLSLQLPTNRPALPRHGLIAEGVTPANLREKKRPIRPQTQSGKSVWVSVTNPFEGVAARCAAGGAKRPPRGVPRGDTPLGDSLVTFSSGRKSPGAWGGAPIQGECRGGSAPPGIDKTRCREVESGASRYINSRIGRGIMPLFVLEPLLVLWSNCRVVAMSSG